MLLFMMVTFAVFSIPVDQPPDDNQIIEITQQTDFVCPVVIEEPILMVSETIYQANEMLTILTSLNNEGDVQKRKATTTHLKKSGTEFYIETISVFKLKLKVDNTVNGIPRIRSPVKNI